MDHIDSIKKIIWSMVIFVVVLSIIITRHHFLKLLILLTLLVSVVFFVLQAALNANPIIFTEEGIIQKWNRAVLWEDIEGYQWIPLGKNYSLLKAIPSESMPILMQINNTRGGFGAIHNDAKKSIEALLASKGITCQD